MDTLLVRIQDLVRERTRWEGELSAAQTASGTDPRREGRGKLARPSSRALAMRAAFSILALVIVAAIVLSLAKKQMTALKPPPAAASATGSGGGALPQPQAVGRQVQDNINDAARRAADEASAATN